MLQGCRVQTSNIHAYRSTTLACSRHCAVRAIDVRRVRVVVVVNGILCEESHTNTIEIGPWIESLVIDNFDMRALYAWFWPLVIVVSDGEHANLLVNPQLEQ